MRGDITDVENLISSKVGLMCLFMIHYTYKAGLSHI